MGETQVYINNNVLLSNGKLLIITKRENYQFRDSTFKYTSGRVKSSFAMKYGYFEVKAKTPEGRGFWPAIWLHSGQSSNCTYREIDLYEGDGNIPNYTSNNAYTQYSSDCPKSPEPTVTNFGWNSVKNKYTHPTNINGSEHIWGLEWSPNVLIFYLDGIELRRIPTDSLFEKPMDFILNTALQRYNYDVRDSTGNIINSFTGVDSTTIMPDTFEVDYVRVYKLRFDNYCSTNETITNFTNYQSNTVKKNITISGTSPITVPGNSTIILRAHNEITINGDFSVPLGSEFGTLISACY
jgi:beta-glucanase (GH16 family)